MENEFNIKWIIQNSRSFDDKLRFPISNLKIKIEDEWKGFNELTGIMELRSFDNNIELREVMLDTGNENNACVLSKHYLNSFKEKIKNIDIESKPYSSSCSSKGDCLISQELFEFKLFDDIIFNSRIGFLSGTVSVYWCFSIYVGINSIMQFLNILLPYDSKKYYFCSSI